MLYFVAVQTAKGNITVISIVADSYDDAINRLLITRGREFRAVMKEDKSWKVL